MKTLVLGVASGISCYKSYDVARAIFNNGHKVIIILTKNAIEFGMSPKIFRALGCEIYTDQFSGYEKNNIGVEHIAIAQQCDCFCVAPSTANIIGKFANGIADDLLSTIHLAIPQYKNIDLYDEKMSDRILTNDEVITGKKIIPKIICPAMNNEMWDNYFVQENICKLAKLVRHGYKILGPVEGKLACGGEPKVGAMVDKKEIIKTILEELK